MDTFTILQSIRQQQNELSIFIQQKSLLVDKIIQDVGGLYHNSKDAKSFSDPPVQQFHKLQFPALNRVLKSHARRSGKEFTPMEFEIPNEQCNNNNNNHDNICNNNNNNNNNNIQPANNIQNQNIYCHPPQRKPPQPPHSKDNQINKATIENSANKLSVKEITEERKELKERNKIKENNKREENKKDKRHEELMVMARRTSAAITIQRAWRASADIRRYVVNHRKARAHRKRVVLSKLLLAWRDYVAMRRWWKSRWSTLVRCWGIKNIHLHLGREFPVTYLTITEGKYVMAARYHAWRTIRKYFLKWQCYMAT